MFGYYLDVNSIELAFQGFMVFRECSGQMVKFHQPYDFPESHALKQPYDFDCKNTTSLEGHIKGTVNATGHICWDRWSKYRTSMIRKVLLMEEIPHNHLRCLKLCLNNGIFTISTGDRRISSINSMFQNGGGFP